jgi:DNA (cytosine-5)-methyltransferase 1
MSLPGNVAGEVNKETMTLGSLYSGEIDAFAYAANKVGIEVLWQVEKRYEAHKYLKKNNPKTKKYFHDDKVGKQNLEWVDIICGGDPCQPSSTAGLGLGKADHRYRWPQMFRICGELRPNWIVNENVVGSISNMVLDQKISDLERIGYTCQAYNIPAIAVGSHHERQRIFLIAHANVQGRGKLLHIDARSIFEKSGSAITLGAQGNAFLQFEERYAEPALFPFPHGIPDHILRLGAAGNSIVSAIPIILLTCIKEIEKNNK